MQIVLKKGSSQQSINEGGNFKKSILHITRSDGSKTWSPIHPGLQDHDIAHYAVEKSLGFTNGFYGLVDKGVEISDFELPKDKKPPLVHPDTMPLEALQSEYIVNLLQTEIWNSGRIENFLEVLRISLNEKEITFPQQLTEEKLEEIRKLYHHYALEFSSMRGGESLTLIFDI